MENKIIVEYSISQKSFFYDTVKNTVVRNINMIIENVNNDYKIIGIVDNIDQALNYINDFKKKLNVRNN